MAYSDFLSLHPDRFWVIVHIAWGGVYAALTVSCVVLVKLQQSWDNRPELRRSIRFLLQLMWGVSHILAAVAVPLVMAGIAPDVLREGKYFWWFAGTWSVATASAYGMAHPIMNAIRGARNDG
ncbi:MAG TPA: hypothetical protein VIL30_07760 [Ramlibacter sp.]